MTRWLVDGNNVYGSRPDGWWNDREAASERLAQRIAEWCRGHDDEVVLVYDPPLAERTSRLAGGNLRITTAARRGRDAADDRLVELAAESEATPGGDENDTVVVTSDKGLIARLPAGIRRMGVGRFRGMIGY